MEFSELHNKIVEEVLIIEPVTDSIPPVAGIDYTISDPCEGFVEFTDQSLNVPTNWYWDFDDGTFSNEENPNHTYLLSGNYDVVLIVSNAFVLIFCPQEAKGSNFN